MGTPLPGNGPARIDKENAAPQRLAERRGFRRVGSPDDRRDGAKRQRETVVHRLARPETLADRPSDHRARCRGPAGYLDHLTVSVPFMSAAWPGNEQKNM